VDIPVVVRDEYDILYIIKESSCSGLLFFNIHHGKDQAPILCSMLNTLETEEYIHVTHISVI